MNDKPAEYPLANHPDEDSEFMEALGRTSRDTDQSQRGQIARALAAFPAMHRSWGLEALESLRGSYSLADYLLAALLQAQSQPSEEKVVSEAKHTPGPWGYTEAMYAGSGVYTIADADRMTVCEVRSFNPEEDAVLIAAAPAMFEALKAFADVLVDVGEDEADSDLYAPMSPANRRATPILVGHLRRARAALSQAQPQPSDEGDG